MKLLFSFILISLCLLFWSMFIEPNILIVKHLTIHDERLKGLKIVFASDFHVKPHETYRLNKIVRTINEQNPDIVLFGGDYVNGHKKGNSLSIEKIAKKFSYIVSKYGTYVVIGNHDGWQVKKK